MEQKYKRGTLVRVTFGHAITHYEDGKSIVKDLSPEQVGREAIIDYSYKERYGGSSDNSANSYSVVFLDDGNSIAWKQLGELEFIDEGGDHLFEQAKANREKIKNQETDINYILPLLTKGEFSSTSILYLFELLGHKSSFISNGEYFVLYNDWIKLHPVFVYISKCDTMEEVRKPFTEDGVLKFNLENVFNTFKQL